jgi:hypothetical protein
MTTEDTKVQCYVKSVKSDARHIAQSLITPALKWVLVVALIVIAGAVFLFLAVVIMNTVTAVAVPYLMKLTPLLTQHTVYIIGLVAIDLLVLAYIKWAQDGEDESLKGVNEQVILGLLPPVLLLVFNGLILVLASDINPERVIGWSYMLAESVINAVVLVLGILLVRAYVRCEGVAQSELVTEGEGTT